MTQYRMIPLISVFYIFIAAVIYIMASFAFPIHGGLSVGNAILLAMPLVFVEYNFSLRGNKIAHANGATTFEILTLTMIFYFISLFIIDKLLKKHEASSKDFLSAGLIATAFYVSFIAKK